MRNDSSSFDPRNRVVSFRLSDQEYELANDFCKSNGFRGLSTLARSAFLAYLPQPLERKDSSDDPGVLQSDLKTLHTELARLIDSLSRFRDHIPAQSQNETRIVSADNVA